jgi:hypothetical protein
MKRPTGVTIIAILGFFGAALLLVAGLAICMGGAMVSRMAHTPMGLMAGMGGALVGVTLLAFAALGIATGVGLLKLQNWARILTIVVAGMTLLVAGLGLLDAMAHVHMIFFFGALMRRMITMAIGVWILIYLFQPDVKQAFGATAF